MELKPFELYLSIVDSILFLSVDKDIAHNFRQFLDFLSHYNHRNSYL